MKKITIINDDDIKVIKHVLSLRKRRTLNRLAKRKDEETLFKTVCNNEVIIFCGKVEKLDMITYLIKGEIIDTQKKY